MKRKFLGGFFVLLIGAAVLAAKPAGNEAALGVTGGPFPGETSCGRARCHNVDANTGPSGIFITAKGMPIEDYKYVPNETIEILVRVADPNQGRWGYQLTARRENDRCGAPRCSESSARNRRSPR